MKGVTARVGAGLFSAAAALLLSASGVLRPLEWKSYDQRLRSSAADSRSVENTALLLIDQKSLDYMEEEEGIGWPWPRSIYVPVIEYCRAAGAKGVIFDVLFTESSVYGTDDDAQLADAMSAKEDILLAVHVSSGDRKTSYPIDTLRDAAAGVGNVSFEPDDDGIFRTVPLSALTSGETVLTLPFAALSRLADGAVERGDDGTITAAGHAVPLDDNGEMLIHYLGPAGTIPSYSIASAIQSYVRSQYGGEITLPPGRLKDRYIFVGMSAPGLMDLRPTPFSPVYPGTEVHATVFENLLSGDFIRVAPWWVEPLRCVVPALLLALLLGVVRGAWKGALLLPLFAAGLVTTAHVAFRLGWNVPFVSPLVAVSLAFLSVRTVEYATEGRKKRFLKHAFRHYLSPGVIDEIVSDPSRLSLGGERKTLTLFFSDLASFTTLSEKLEPERLTHLLNRYLTEMTGVILGEGGTVDKFEGDAIIAFWNAPADQADHAERGLRTAMLCLEKLKEINPEMKEICGSPLAMRIGMHTGPVVVGNMGSNDRFDYTVLGDAANLASRLEGLGKVFRTPIIVSEATWKAGKGAVDAREIGMVRVVGRKEATRIFQPTVRRGDMPFFRWWRKDDPTFAAALAAYYRGEIAAALEKFSSLGDDPVAGVYRERCEEFSGKPLPDGWDGVWTMGAK